jgi:hypothetical protein
MEKGSETILDNKIEMLEEKELVSMIGGMVHSELKRGNMDIKEWTKFVEEKASELAESMSRQLNRQLKAEVSWHGHAEISIVPVNTESYLITEDEDSGEELRSRTDSILNVWVD